MMGSGGMIVMDEDTCMVNVARYFLSFLREESCGKCTPCREGLAQMLHVLERVTKGEGRAGDVERLEQLGELLEGTALCALGKTAAYPVLSTVRYFRSEYDAHIDEQRCPAKECRGLFAYEIDAEACKACGLCRKHSIRKSHVFFGGEDGSAIAANFIHALLRKDYLGIGLNANDAAKERENQVASTDKLDLLGIASLLIHKKWGRTLSADYGDARVLRELTHHRASASVS